MAMLATSSRLSPTRAPQVSFGFKQMALRDLVFPSPARKSSAFNWRSCQMDAECLWVIPSPSSQPQVLSKRFGRILLSSPPLGSEHYAALRPDGKLLVSGIGADLSDGKVNFGLVRLVQNGAVDPGFVMAGGISVPNLGIQQVSVQPNGSLVVRGDFTLVNGVRRSQMAHLNPDGTMDSQFELGDIVFVDAHFALTPENQILVGGSVCSENSGRCDYGLWRLFSNGIRDSTYSRLLFCEGISDVVFHPRAGVLLSTRTGGGCWSSGSSLLLRLVSAVDGALQFEIDVTSRSQFGVYPGSIDHVLPYPLDGRTYVIGEFTHLGENPCGRVTRLLNDGTPDRSFGLARPELLESGALGAHVEGDGTLRLLVVKNNFGTAPNSGRLLTVDPSGLPVADFFVAAPLPQTSIGTFRCSDGSWIVMERTWSSQWRCQRISPWGQRVASRSVPFEGAEDKVALGLDASDRFLVAAPLMLTSNGPWSGLLRLEPRALAPINLRFAVSTNARTLLVEGPTDQRIRIETSSNLTVWSDWMEITLSAGTNLIEVPDALPEDRFFYRGVLVE